MAKKRKHYGFSLTEVLLAMATLSIGMIFVAGVFPVAIHFSTVATERTFGAVVADEAFTKIRLYNRSDPDWVLRLPPDGCVDFNDVVTLYPGEFSYPSDPCTDVAERRYWWSALLRRVSPDPTSRLVQVTVFVCRRTGSGMRYRDPIEPVDGRVPYPIPVEVGVPEVLESNVLRIQAGRETFINDGYTIVEDEIGRLYRVLRRDPEQTNTIILDRPWQGGSSVWVVPPPVGGGRYPCVAVYQKVIAF